MDFTVSMTRYSYLTIDVQADSREEAVEEAYRLVEMGEAAFESYKDDDIEVEEIE